MTRNYKLAANFNTVEFTITEDDLLEVVTPEELQYDEDHIVTYTVSDEELIKRILQREYDILASINVINIAPDIKQAKKPAIEPPSEKLAKWAESLGMKDPMSKSKKEVWEFVNKNKNK